MKIKEGKYEKYGNSVENREVFCDSVGSVIDRYARLRERSEADEQQRNQ
jgi:hypothetical protein